jgi:hypothetical protein
MDAQESFAHSVSAIPLTGKVRRVFPFPTGDPLMPASDLGLEITPEGTVIAAALHNRLLVWRAATGEQLGEAEAEASALALSPDGSLAEVYRLLRPLFIIC